MIKYSNDWKGVLNTQNNHLLNIKFTSNEETLCVNGVKSLDEWDKGAVFVEMPGIAWMLWYELRIFRHRRQDVDFFSTILILKSSCNTLTEDIPVNDFQGTFNDWV